MMETNGPIRSSYLSDAMDPRQLPRIVRELKKGILDDGVQFNAIAFRGMSGALVAPLLALTMKKGLIVCRKPTEMSHASSVEGHLEGGSYIIVDDFVSSGTTVKAIIREIATWRETHNREKMMAQPSGSPYDFFQPSCRYREKTEAEKLPMFVCERVFVYQRNGDQRWVCEDPECGEYNHDDGGCEARRVPVVGTKIYY